ncbi:MAG: LicD family protein [Thermoplasmatales archaeon]|nr:LicD family protein [Thermoplasmatales archaeon]
MANKENIILILKEIKGVHDKYQIPFWLEYGSLLGAVRGGKIIDGDYDIDLATFFDVLMDKFETISKELYDMGYDIYITETRMAMSKENIHASIYLYNTNVVPKCITRNRKRKKNFMGKTLIYCFLRPLQTSHKDLIHNYTPRIKTIQMIKSVMRHLPSRNKLYNLLLSFGKKINCLDSFNVNVPESYVDTFKEITFCDVNIKIPKEEEKYLEQFYGKTWKIPDKNWHQKDKKRQRIDQERNAIGNLSQMVKILDDNNIHFWLHGGAILGFIRSGKRHLIPYDHDFDLLTWTHSFDDVKKLVPQIEAKGFRTKITKDKVKIFKDGYEFTVGAFELDGDKAVRATVSVRNKFGVLLYYKLIIKISNKFILKLLLYLGYITGSIIPIRKFIPAKYFTELKKIDFFGVEINIPKDTIDYLEFKYGADWRTPIQNWSHKGLKQHYVDDTFDAYYKRGWI